MKKYLSFIAYIISFLIIGDNYYLNSTNNYGSLGLINTPSARFYDSPASTLSFYRGFPDRKINLTLYPYDWLEASIFYSSIKDKEYGPDFSQDYKDKGFNLKIRIKEEDNLPAIAIGFNDIGGTGFYSSEYIVSSYSIGNYDFHLGASWGALNHYNHFDNPFVKISDRFRFRDSSTDQGGKVNFKNFFSGESASLFGGINYKIRDNLTFKLEYDPTLTPGELPYKERKSDISLGISYLNKNSTIGFNFERGSNLSINFTLRDNFFLKEYDYVKPTIKSDDKYKNLINNLNLNGIGVSKIEKNDEETLISFTQFNYQLEELEDIIDKAIENSNLTEKIIRTYKVAGLNVTSNHHELEKPTKIYENNFNGLNQKFSLNIRPFIAGREDFIKAALLLEYDSEYVFSENLFFSTNLKYSLLDNFDDLIFPPIDTYPAQVRSDVKKYLNNLGDEISIGRAQLEYFETIDTNNHILISAGIFEEMFSGLSFEYLNYDPNRYFNWGFEINEVFKRDYDFRFGLLGYKNTTYHINTFYKNRNLIPFDLKVSFGEYLAGDKGATFEISRKFNRGIEIGAFASFTDVSFDEFGEGSFDKGIFFRIPFGANYNLTNFLWRPLTKDPASKLNKKNDLYSLVDRYSTVKNK